MTTSTMKSKHIKRFAVTVAVILFWITVWYVAALLVNSKLLLPTPKDTLLALLALFGTGDFYTVVLFTMLRVISGLVIGIIVGVILAILCHKFSIVKSIFSPIISVIRATPVAAFIVLVWVLVKGNGLTVIVAFLMVMPIVWQNTLDGFEAIPKDLIEVANVFGLTYKKRMRVLLFPILKSFIFPAIITSVGLAWKSEIAAEIIAYTKDSIGMYINDAKVPYQQAPTIFAWTAVIITLSITLEKLTGILLRRLAK